jgi:DNA processing protein
VIVSGLARGIDAEAHRGALEAGGATIGVLACGIDRMYPPEHRGLAEAILRSGAVVSELPLGTLPRPLHFPLRNRIISGLSRAIVVVEARRRSGSLITVRHALDQGREVFVVPGPVDGPHATGTNQLLREGARAIQSARDVLEDLALTTRPRRRIPGESEDVSNDASGDTTSLRGPKRLEVWLMALLADGPRTLDELLLEAGSEPGEVATVLLELELSGSIVEERDGRFHVCRDGSRRAPSLPSLSSAPSPDREASTDGAQPAPGRAPGRRGRVRAGRADAGVRPTGRPTKEVPP